MTFTHSCQIIIHANPLTSVHSISSTHAPTINTARYLVVKQLRQASIEKSGQIYRQGLGMQCDLGIPVGISSCWLESTKVIQKMITHYRISQLNC